MAIKISKPADSLSSKPKLTKFGKFVILGAVIVVLAVIIALVTSSSKNRETAGLRAELSSAVERSLSVCKTSISSISTSETDINKVNEFVNNIEDEQDVLKKASIAKECIAFVMGKASGNTAVVDELNGAQNRILIAEKNLKNK